VSDEEQRKAKMYLETAALGFASCVHFSSADPESSFADRQGARDFLVTTALALASTMGALDAKERAELDALRRMREGIAGLRAELVAGVAEMDGPMDRKLAVETIDALFSTSYPKVGARLAELESALRSVTDAATTDAEHWQCVAAARRVLR